MKQAAAFQHPPFVPGSASKRPPKQKTSSTGRSDRFLEIEADRIADAVVAAKPGDTIHEASAAADVELDGAPLSPSERAYFEPRFGRDLSDVRIHTGAEGAAAARSINARAFTLGNDVAFAPGQYRPDSNQGRRLMAHELAHVVQQRQIGARVQRQPAQSGEVEMPAQWAFADPVKRTWRRYARSLALADAARIRKAGTLSAGDRDEINAKLSFFEGEAHAVYSGIIRSALVEITQEEIEMPAVNLRGPAPAAPPDPMANLGAGNAFFQRMLAHPNYIDNDIKEVNYYTAEQADIHYKDGSMLRLGLVPKWMEAPVVEVDYQTPRQHFNLIDRGKDCIGFFRLAEHANLPGSTPYGELLKNYMHKVEFYADGKSGRIVPSHVNMLTAPTLCAVLLDSLRRYEEQVDLGVQLGMGGVAAIGPYAGAGGWAKAPGVGTTTITASRMILSPTARTLAREMEALVGQGGSKTITVGGVRFTDVAVSREGTRLAVKRFEIRRMNAPPGQGSIAAEAFEDAAVNVARSQGAKSVSINVGVIVNPGWRQWMESLGYAFNQTEGAWIKTIKL